MKKRIMAVALAGMMALSLAACGGSSAKSEGTTAAAGSSAAEQNAESVETKMDGEDISQSFIFLYIDSGKSGGLLVRSDRQDISSCFGLI